MSNNAPEKPTLRSYPPRPWDVDDRRVFDYPQHPRKRYPRDDGRERSDEEDTEFQKFVYGSAGIRLPIYGQNFFRREPGALVSRERVPVPADYQLAAGDTLLIHAWGQVEVNARVIVDRNGEILLPKVGAVGVIGVRFDQLRDHLKNAIGRVYRNFDLSVSLGQMRTLHVFVVGRARKPGRYSVGSLTSLTNLLFYAGGPAKNGTLRRLQLKREGRVFAEFDAYDLLLRGDRSKDVALQPGDVLYIPAIGPQVAVLGSVNQPAIYELGHELSVAEQIEEAGGLSTTADAHRVLLERIDNRAGRSVTEFALDEEGQARRLKDGDVLRVFPVSPRFENAVTLRGNVAHPGRYPWKPGMRLHDLIPSRAAIITSDYWAQQNLLGRTDEGWIAAGEKEFRNDRDPSAHQGRAQGTEAAKSGNQEKVEPPPGQKTVSDQHDGKPANQRELTQVKRNPAEVNWDYAVLQRLNVVDLASQLLPFNLGRALDDPGSADDLPLEAGDVVTVFSQEDLSVPVARRTKFVRIEGEVRSAGIYRAEAGESLREIIARAGGLTPQAYLFAADFRRESTRQEQQQQMERMLTEMDKQLRSKASGLAAYATAEERLAAREELETERDLIGKLRRTRATGRIVLDLKPSDHEVDALPPLPLEDGDRIEIPAQPATVDVIGAVYNQNSFIYKAGRNAGAYLDQAGGATRDADSSRMFVIRADGSVVSKQMRGSIWGGKLESLKLMPGDSVVVPERIRRGSLLRGLRDWSQVFAQFALGAAAIRVVSP